MPFDFHAYEKIRRAAMRLKEDRWSTISEIKSFYTAPDDGKPGANRSTVPAKSRWLCTTDGAGTINISGLKLL